jgi:DNA-binding HxlR family transcriptional regulator
MISTVTLLRALADGPMRSDSLLRRFDGIDFGLLVLTLRSLEGRGLVERRMERVYGLTSAGRGLLGA